VPNCDIADANRAEQKKPPEGGFSKLNSDVVDQAAISTGLELRR
jgi:hypothetical protein